MKNKTAVKISYKDWAYIGQYNPVRKWLRPLCSYTLIKEADGRFKREQRVSWPVYLIIFIPVHIVQALWCIWDGGLKEFEINERYVGGEWFMPGSVGYDYAKAIWESKYK